VYLRPPRGLWVGKGLFIIERGQVMYDEVMFLDCPAYLDRHGSARCGLPAEVEHRYTMGSTDGPLESARISCPRGHWFNGPIESLTWDKSGSKTAGAAPPAQVDGRRPS
jgi:hypothetical protein